MKITDRVKLATNILRGTPATNSGSLRAARAFLKHGNGERMTPDWSQVIMSDNDIYTGYMYGAIDIRAVTATKIGEYYLKTRASKKIAEAAKKEEYEVTHPYLALIDESKTFSNFDFWYDNATYLDLKGVAYILAVRNIGANGLIGKVQEFKVLNPYMVQRIFDNTTKELIGYKEYKGSTSRDIPKEMIIPVIKLNPFDPSETYSMADAAKDHQFTLKTAGDYTRSAIRNNINAPGIITTDAELDGEDLINFKARVTGKVKGEPIFGGGAGSIKWEDMQADLNKAALGDVNSISLNNIIAVSGASKTMLGIEESGTTRDTGKGQKDNFIDYRTIPLVQKIIDALNQDYKNYYQSEYAEDKYRIYIDNPLGTDRDAEQKDVEIRTSKEELYEKLVDKGYDRELAAKYADGLISLTDLGQPTNAPRVTASPENQATIVLKQNEHNDTHEHSSDNQHINDLQSGLLDQTQASLQNTIINIDNRLLMAVSNEIGQAKNQFEEEQDVIATKEKKALQNELEIALAAFYGIILPLYAYNVLSERLETYGKATSFKMNNTVRAFIKDIAGKASTSHIDTTLKSMMKFAQKQSLSGQPRDAIVRGLQNKFGGEIANSRAVLIARTETARAFTMSQYQADLQFIKQGGYEGRAFKQWTTRSGNPCEFCIALSEQAPIPFDQPFASIGDELTGTSVVDGKTIVKKMSVTFMDIEAGVSHPNCGCIYELIIR